MRIRKSLILLITVLFCTSVGLSALDDGLEAYYKFDSGSGDTIKDSSVNSNSGSINGASWITGVEGSALSFDGSDDGVTVPGSTSLNFDGTNKLSTTAWVKFQGEGVECCNTIVGQRDVSAWVLRYDTRVSTNEIELIVNDGNTWMGDGDSYGIERPPLGEWHFLGAVYDGNEIKMYKDGELIESYSFSGNIQSSGSETKIGTAKDGKLKGDIDNVRIYKRALSTSEIKKIYQNETEFCNIRGPKNECIINEKNDLEASTYNVNSIFESTSNAELNSLNGQARINITNSTSISGLWTGSFFIDTNRPRIVSGARFKSFNGDIVIGN